MIISTLSITLIIIIIVLLIGLYFMSYTIKDLRDDVAREKKRNNDILKQNVATDKHQPLDYESS